MLVESNADVPQRLTSQILQAFLEDVFVLPEFNWRALAVCIDTSGPGSGYGLQGYFYDDAGQWTAAKFRPDDEATSELFYSWIAATYAETGHWFECMISIFKDDRGARAGLEFEFQDIDRWGVPDDDQTQGDLFRPAELRG